MELTEVRGYRILYPLGQGGFGKTFLVEDMQAKTPQQYVLKQFCPQTTDAASYQIAQERFQKEASVLLDLGQRHPQIPKLYGYFCHDEAFYLVLEYIEGMTLSQKVREHGPLASTLVVQILVEILQILEVIHAEKIIHRDIKPDNIILRSSDNKPVLIDFGAVKECLHTLLQGQYAATSIVIGSPGYIAPEQAAGRPGYFSDIYSLGMTAIYLLTGKSLKQLQEHPSDYSLNWQAHAPSLSAEIAAVIDRAVQLHPSDRFTTATQMLQALSRELSTPTTLVPGARLAATPAVSLPYAPEVQTNAPPTAVASHDSHRTSPTLPVGIPNLQPTKTGAAPTWPSGLIGAAVALGVFLLGMGGVYIYQHSQGQGQVSPAPTPSDTSISENGIDESAAITLLEELYTHLSNRDYEAAQALYSPRLVKLFDPKFFQQFRRVTVDNLRISSRTRASLNFIGDNTYVWPDGTTQREQRSFTVRRLEGRLQVTASEFIKVTDIRGSTHR